MKFAGLDLGGVNSRVCIRDTDGSEQMGVSEFPQRPSVVLFPLIRKELLLAGNAALNHERGVGHSWPPLAAAVNSGWSRDVLPCDSGRVLLSTVWQCLREGANWQETTWQPTDGLPSIHKPPPADCITAEAESVLLQAGGDKHAVDVVLAIPNQLPEESQEALLSRLPVGTRLVWRAVAAAMAWSQSKNDRLNTDDQLVVLDAGLDGIEVSIFSFRVQKVKGKTFYLPVRQLNLLRTFKTGSMLVDSPAPFISLQTDNRRFEAQLAAILEFIGQRMSLLVCGPLGGLLTELLKRKQLQLNCPPPDGNIIASGAALFAWRLGQGLPTYLDILPSLELFTLTEEHEPKWLVLIPSNTEVAGGDEFAYVHSRRIFIEQGTTRLASWLQRSGENDFRKLTTDLPVQAACDAWVDLRVSAKSAGGFARVFMAAPQGEFEVFGAARTVSLNWLSMERKTREPKDKWPADIVKFGWPSCGKLYSYRQFFHEYLDATSDLDSIFSLHESRQRIHKLVAIKEAVRKTVVPRLAGVTGAGGDAAPVNQLVCFGTEVPCEFSEITLTGQSVTTNPFDAQHERALKVGRQLWRRLQELLENPRANTQEVNAAIYILGRMAGYAPERFQDLMTENLLSGTNSVRLFALGRVLKRPDHGKRLFAVLDFYATAKRPLNNNWIRMLVYVLYQRPEVMREVPREHLYAAALLCVEVFEAKVEQRNVRILFMNSLRAMALLLRARRYSQNRDFLCTETCPEEESRESRLAKRFRRALEQTVTLHLNKTAELLVTRVSKWLVYAASTDEMPPIAPPD